jgi:hypothetical protein
MNVFIIILLLNIVNGYLISPKNKIQYFYGNYILRTTDDLSLKSKYTFLVLSENNKIKLKTINLKGIFSSKVSRSGTIVFAKNHKLFNPFLENDIDIQVKFNNINKYTFSILGIEFPEIKYKEISYVKQKNFRLKQKIIHYILLIMIKNFIIYSI